MKKILHKLIGWNPVKGEPVRKPKKKTTMPVEGVSLYDWMHGTWKEQKRPLFINKKD